MKSIGLQIAMLIMATLCIEGVMGDLSGFKDCQKTFGFSKKLKEQEKTSSINDDVIEELDGYLERQEIEELSGNIVSSSLIDQDLSNFYHCLSKQSNCQELIDSKQTKSKTVSIPYKQCFQNCYNPNYYSSSLVKDVTEFSLGCAKTHLSIEVSFPTKSASEEGNDQSDGVSIKPFGRRQPWGVMVFGGIIATLIVGWTNVDRIKKKLSHKWKFAEENNNDLVEIYELNPDYLARKKYEENLQKMKQENAYHMDLFSKSQQQHQNKNLNINNNNNRENNDLEQQQDNVKQVKEDIQMNNGHINQGGKAAHQNNSNRKNSNNKNINKQELPSQQHTQELQISEVTTNVQKIDVLFKNSPNKKVNYQSPNASLMNENNGLLNENGEDDSYLDDFDKNDPFDL